MIDNRVVHIWHIPLDRSHLETRKLSELLSEEEQVRAKRFHDDRNRKRFIVVHGILRIILSGYTNIPANHLVFGSNLNGKPYLKHAHNNKNVEFNLAHSQDQGILAVAIGRSVGIDLEFIRSIRNYSKMAQSVFTESENRELRLIPEDKRLIAFFTCWARKEAYVKSIGLGLSHFQSFNVNVEPEVECVYPEINPGCELDHDASTIRTINLLPGYIGAVAAKGLDWEVKLFGNEVLNEKCSFFFSLDGSARVG